MTIAYNHATRVPWPRGVTSNAANGGTKSGRRLIPSTHV
jgi:hypothetical protein